MKIKMLEKKIEPKWLIMSLDNLLKHLERINEILEKNFPGYELKSHTIITPEENKKLTHYDTLYYISKVDTKIKELKSEKFKKTLDSSFIFAKISLYQINNEKNYVAELLNVCPIEIIKKNEDIFDIKL